MRSCPMRHSSCLPERRGGRSTRRARLEVRGRDLHEYKFDETVKDKVVLDLIYETRDINRRLGSEVKIEPC